MNTCTDRGLMQNTIRFYLRTLHTLLYKAVDEGLLTYCRKKTNQQITIAWEQELQEIVDRYSVQTENTHYMLPVIKNMDETEYVQYKRMQVNVNRALKRIGAMAGLKLPVTMYVARHSWANIARDMDISISVISEGMGHQSCKTTQIYLDTLDASKINEANRKIIGEINKT